MLRILKMKIKTILITSLSTLFLGASGCLLLGPSEPTVTCTAIISEDDGGVSCGGVECDPSLPATCDDNTGVCTCSALETEEVPVPEYYPVPVPYPAPNPRPDPWPKPEPGPAPRPHPVPHDGPHVKMDTNPLPNVPNGPATVGR